MAEPGFHIAYENPHPLIAEPERFEEYDLKSAFYDYVPPGLGATIQIDGYQLRLTDLTFINLVRESLLLAEQLFTLAPEPSENLRKFLPHLPPETRIYYWIVADVISHSPVLLFAADHATARIYTRTASDVSGLELFVSPEGDLPDPVLMPRLDVIEEIRSFLSRYLDDLSVAFPFIHDDPMYIDYRKRLAALAR